MKPEDAIAKQLREQEIAYYRTRSAEYMAHAVAALAVGDVRYAAELTAKGIRAAAYAAQLATVDR